MFTRIFFVIFLVIALAGCATSARKQEKQAQPSTYERTSKTYQQKASSWDDDYDTDLPTESYGQPTKTTYSAWVQLSAKQIQKALKNAGFYQGSIDGKIGPRTKEAIIKFQKAHSLKPDAIVGKKTSAELNKYLSR